MGHSSIRIKVRRRKVAQLAAYSRQHTVNNMPKNKPTFERKECSTQKFNEGKDVHYVQKVQRWDEKKYPQPKILRKAAKGLKWIRLKDGTVQRVKWEHKSQFQNKKPKLWKDMGLAEKMETYVQDKLKKWEKKHPKPCPEDDLFKEEFIPKWNEERDEALMRIRDFVVSVYDKLHVVGNYVDRKEGKLVEKTVAEVKDIGQKGHNVNHPNLKETDKLYKDATKAAVVAMDKDPAIVDCGLKNHKGDQKRPLIHAKRSKSMNLKQQRELRKAA